MFMEQLDRDQQDCVLKNHPMSLVIIKGPYLSLTKKIQRLSEAGLFRNL